MTTPQSNHISLDDAVRRAGGAPAVAKACGKTPRAIYKWLANGTLPRTDFTGETNYADVMAELSSAGAEPYTSEELITSLRRSFIAA
ncbi:MAG: hypothetical protein CMI02_07480 [Oceanospirillaceae bacterium]|nr:hypothetical protein [Oceanospirillaceae bacterium]